MERESKFTPKSAATLLSNVLNGTRFYPYFAQFIVGGVGETPELFDIDPSGGLLARKRFAVTGSGTELALSLLDSVYKESMSKEEGVQTAVKAVMSAKKRDIFSGGAGVDVLVFSKSGKAEQFEVADAEKAK